MKPAFPINQVPDATIVFQLKKMLQDRFGQPLRGKIGDIVKATGLRSPEVAGLLRGTASKISFRALQKIVAYLATELQMSHEEVLPLLFGFEAIGFWPLLEDCRVETYLGVRSDPYGAEPRWINAYDAFLSNNFISHLVAVGHLRLCVLEQRLIKSYHAAQNVAGFFDEVRVSYEAFSRRKGKRALVSFGSMKSDPMSECIVAAAFGAKPFLGPKNLTHPRQRRVPFCFEYRTNDPAPPSAWGTPCMDPARPNRPGIHVELGGDDWQYFPNDATHDAAVVLYVYRPQEARVEVVFGGYSGRATGCLALALSDLVTEIWPPSYSRAHLKLGAFIIRYEFAEAAPAHLGVQSILLPPSHREVVPIPADILARRLEGVTLPPADNAQDDADEPPAPRRPR
jgi:hypothetical protein